MMKIISKRDKMVGMKSMLSSPFVSSQRPNTELAAASTEQREFRVVVMPACGGGGSQDVSFCSVDCFSAVRESGFYRYG